MDLADITYFFDCCIGQWSIERTYHYIAQREVERSHTDFRVDGITPELRRKVLADNSYVPVDDIDQLPGFQLAFHTVSDKGEEVSQELRALFVPKQQTGTVLTGDYLRDRAYEEDRPIISTFTYDQSNRELLMTTSYTRVVSVDSILLVNPNTRIRRILNYHRPAEGEAMDTLALVGFGVEEKVE
ncbi:MULTISPECIES: phycobiliprotein lyase [Cyanophyceae]|uniref:phycobiliprotein lyase n=1 Tax=Cyanophyceae TaxID=3028117 RepID=UPI0016854768|nr:MULTISPECIES: phycobiliprotein lyase [Cyanophyceae]MBD1917586.1 phycobiliprotein lyase [Phormidium sp. FACHB-77]MBD2029539.1 phycobiliprotein lyase [Phormidium sp. FACHB-322]MBD2050800.1 phycobiliprotein lyase [Leptolyngbya sp. FACHB-60]